METQEIKKEQELNKTADKQTETQAQEGTHFEHVKETLELLYKTFPKAFVKDGDSVKKGDVLISTVRPERNTIALVNHELDEPMIASNGFCVLRPENVNPYYLYAYCKSDLFKNSLSGLATSSMYPTVSDKDILNMPIIYPDISTQKNIEEKVEASFRKIQEAQQDINQAIELIK